MNHPVISIDTKTTVNPRLPSNHDPYPTGVSINSNNDLIPDRITRIRKSPSIQFASALTHEVRNPLTNINLAVEMLKRMSEDEAQKPYLDIIMRASKRINDLVNELLKHQQADDGHTEEYSVQQLLNEVVEMTQDRIKLKNITVFKNYTGDCKIMLNKPKMKIALINIIINAIDAMACNGQMKLLTQSIGDKFIVQIKDNGCGISKENVKNIFKPYFTNKPDGMGLGLSTTYNILQTNQVEISVKSKLGLGTSFTLCFNKSHCYNSLSLLGSEISSE